MKVIQSIQSKTMKQESAESNKKVKNLRRKGLLVITENENPNRLENETQKIIERHQKMRKR